MPEQAEERYKLYVVVDPELGNETRLYYVTGPAGYTEDEEEAAVLDWAGLKRAFGDLDDELLTMVPWQTKAINVLRLP